MKKKIEKITDSELEVLKVLWKADQPLMVSDIRKSIMEITEWEPSTIKTLLYRLCDKEVVQVEKRNVNFYKPLVSEDEYIQFVTQSMIDRVYGGSTRNLVASLINGRKLNNADIEELQKMFRVDE